MAGAKNNEDFHLVEVVGEGLQHTSAQVVLISHDMVMSGAAVDNNGGHLSYHHL
jgi:hypothetical protein